MSGKPCSWSLPQCIFLGALLYGLLASGDKQDWAEGDSTVLLRGKGQAIEYGATEAPDQAESEWENLDWSSREENDRYFMSSCLTHVIIYKILYYNNLQNTIYFWKFIFLLLPS